jgi:hypothetical protein
MSFYDYLFIKIATELNIPLYDLDLKPINNLDMTNDEIFKKFG